MVQTKFTLHFLNFLCISMKFRILNRFLKFKRKEKDLEIFTTVNGPDLAQGHGPADWSVHGLDGLTVVAA
jgi:hypothetical protein